MALKADLAAPAHASDIGAVLLGLGARRQCDLGGWSAASAHTPADTRGSGNSAFVNLGAQNDPFRRACIAGACR